jgi:hypothetical protein
MDDLQHGVIIALCLITFVFLTIFAGINIERRKICDTLRYGGDTTAIVVEICGEKVLTPLGK